MLINYLLFIFIYFHIHSLKSIFLPIMLIKNYQQPYKFFDFNYIIFKIKVLINIENSYFK